MATIEPRNKGRKFDSGKPDASLLLEFPSALMEVARIGSYGAKKYDRGNWKLLKDGKTRYTAAMLRHLLLEQGESRDGEGLLHAGCVAWNALARLEFILGNGGKHESKR